MKQVVFYKDFQLGEEVLFVKREKMRFPREAPCCEMPRSEAIPSKEGTVSGGYWLWVEGKFCPNCGYWKGSVETDPPMGGACDPTSRPCWAKIRKFAIDDLEIPTHRLMNYLANNKQDLNQVGWQKLEDIVAAIFREHLDCRVEQTKRTRDNGYDLLCFDSESDPFIVEVKHTKGERVIGVSVVRELIGTMMLEDMDRAFLVSSSRFSRDAKETAKRASAHSLQLQLKDREDILDWLEQLYRAGGPDLGDHMNKIMDQVFLAAAQSWSS